MRFVDGLALEEISVALDIPLGTVKSRIHNAIAALRKDPRVRNYFEPG
jgi:RNA polymerase sigma-70 factor, ECF subfamily